LLLNPDILNLIWLCIQILNPKNLPAISFGCVISLGVYWKC
jgi:hypothetical protein